MFVIMDKQKLIIIILALLAVTLVLNILWSVDLISLALGGVIGYFICKYTK